MTAFVLDMDGVIVDSELAHVHTIELVLKRFGIRYSRAEHLTRFAGTGSKHIFSTMLKKHGIHADIEALVRERKALYQRLIKRRRLKTIAGVRHFLREAKKRSIPLAIATGGHRLNVIASLKSARLPTDFKIISVEDVKARKPHPAIFLAAARALHARPRDCIVFEDSIAGVQAAKRARMKCVALLTTTTRSSLKQAGADLIIKDFRDPRLWRWLEIDKEK